MAVKLGKMSTVIERHKSAHTAKKAYKNHWTKERSNFAHLQAFGVKESKHAIRQR